MAQQTQTSVRPEERDFEVIVIGGGIQGAGCAQACAAAGYRTCLLEQEYWGAGTSSRSSKLIHGGLRYLQSHQWQLVRTSLRERRLLRELAPDLIKPLPFYIPVYRHSRHRPWQIRAGLSLYALLGGRDALARFRRLPPAQWQQLPGLRQQDLLAVFQYWDTQTDDLLLTQAVVESAIDFGADARERTQVLGGALGASGYALDCAGPQGEYRLESALLINAAGPWAPRLQQRIAGAPAPAQVELVQGAHLELAGQLSEGIFYVESPLDGRPVFIMPWQGHTLIGTTETAFQGDPAQVAATAEEEAYLLATLAHYFPAFPVQVIGRFAGLRVLPIAAGAFSARPRETLIQIDRRPGAALISLYGGKLTAYRATAAEVLSQVRQRLGSRPGGRDTAQIHLTLPRQGERR